MKKFFSKNLMTTVLSSAVALGAIASPVSVLANEYDALIDETNQAINFLSNEQANVHAVLQAAYAEIQAIQEEAADLQAAVSQDDQAIADLEIEIAELEETIAKREVLLADQARAAQVQGGSTNYLEAIASAESISDFVGRIDVVRKMVSANKDLLNDQKADMEAVLDMKMEVLEAKDAKVNHMVELEGLKANLEEQQVAAQNAYDQLTNDISLAAEQRDALVAEKAAFEEAQYQARLAAEQAAAEQAAYEQAMAEQAAAEQAAYEEALAQEAAAQEEVQVEEVQEDQVAEEASIVDQFLAEQEAEAAQEAFEVETEVEYETSYVESIQIEEHYDEETGETYEVEVPVVEEVQTPVESEEVFEEEVYQEVAEESVQEEVQVEAEEVYQEPEVQAPVEVEEVVEEVEVPAAPEASYGSNYGDIHATASKYLGTDYVWGGKSPSGFDCSGFVQYVYQEAYGKNVGGWTGEQENAGTRIGVGEAQSGDLLFWGDPGSTYHVAIALGGNDYIHAVDYGTPLSYGTVNDYFMPSFAVRVH